jgi:hypothetical protein
MKICFFGVGGYFGTLITKRFQNDHDIYFIARGVHKDAIVKNELTLKKAGVNEIIDVCLRYALIDWKICPSAIL